MSELNPPVSDKLNLDKISSLSEYFRNLDILKKDMRKLSSCPDIFNKMLENRSLQQSVLQTVSICNLSKTFLDLEKNSLDKKHPLVSTISKLFSSVSKDYPDLNFSAGTNSVMFPIVNYIDDSLSLDAPQQLKLLHHDFDNSDSIKDSFMGYLNFYIQNNSEKFGHSFLKVPIDTSKPIAPDDIMSKFYNITVADFAASLEHFSRNIFNFQLDLMLGTINVPSFPSSLREKVINSIARMLPSTSRSAFDDYYSHNDLFSHIIINDKHYLTDIFPTPNSLVYEFNNAADLSISPMKFVESIKSLNSDIPQISDITSSSSFLECFDKISLSYDLAEKCLSSAMSEFIKSVYNNIFNESSADKMLKFIKSIPSSKSSEIIPGYTYSLVAHVPDVVNEVMYEIFLNKNTGTINYVEKNLDAQW